MQKAQISAAKENLKKAIRGAIKECFEDAFSDEAIWDEFDRLIQEQLEKSSCFLTFDESIAEILVGVGEGNAAHTFTPEVQCELYEDCDFQAEPELRAGQIGNVKDQIAGIDKFVAHLLEWRTLLAAKVEGL